MAPRGRARTADLVINSYPRLPFFGLPHLAVTFINYMNINSNLTLMLCG